MIALANERLQLLRDRGYEDACIYGENEMEGLHVIQVLKHGTKPHGAVENPQIPPAAFLSGIMKPVTAVGAGATVLGLAAMFGLAAGTSAIRWFTTTATAIPSAWKQARLPSRAMVLTNVP